ncbi:MAG: pyridoxal-phosphate dependent enzyme [Candidatus Lokiarchaeota archaeon]|nr:pyridoxal-phosphate dependent enzyme [Candidatus Lokiarchaeota archaeon]
MPSIKDDYKVSLGEGCTPLRASKKLGKKLSINNLFFKDETTNPTNSFKDRAAALLISHARSWNYQSVICASNGNQGASIAAYASLEAMECVNVIPEEIDVGKRAQMIAYNSKIVVSGKTVDDAINEVLKPKYDVYYQCTPEHNPLTIEAQKTIAFELVNKGIPPDWVIVPMGSGGLIVSLWNGFRELFEAKVIQSLPKLVGVQSQASAPIVQEFEKNVGLKKVYGDTSHKSRALGILVVDPMYHELAIKAILDTRGRALAIPENIMISSAEELARNEGIFAEPASALTISALNSLIQKNEINKEHNVVCLITGSGLKTPHVLDAISNRAKTAGSSNILSTKLKLLSQISLSEKKGIHGSKLKEIIGTISLPAIYQHLKELEAKNLITRKKEGKTVLYFITDNGKKALEALDILITLL